MNFDNAIPVATIAEEYEIVKEQGFSTMIKQALTIRNGRKYDILTFENDCGARKEFCFLLKD